MADGEKPGAAALKRAKADERRTSEQVRVDEMVKVFAGLTPAGLQLFATAAVERAPLAVEYVLLHGFRNPQALTPKAPAQLFNADSLP